MSSLLIHDSATVIPACVRASAPHARTHRWLCLQIWSSVPTLGLKSKPALICSFTSKTTKAGPTIMKKAAVEGSAWRRLPIFFLLLGVCLSLSLPIKQHMGYIFSKLRLSLAAPYSFWKRIDEFRRKRVFFFACSFACVLFVLFLSTWYSFSTKRTSDMQVPLQ